MTTPLDEIPPPPGDPAPLQPERRGQRFVATRAIRAMKAQYTSERTFIERAADALNEVAASTPFLVGHVLWFAVWVSWNTGLLGLPPFDPYPFGLLTMVVSLEAIFLSIFVLMAQKRESAIAELREEVGLQVNLRIEEEVTKTLQLVAGLYARMGYRVAEDAELREMLQPLDLARMEGAIMEQIQASSVARRQETH